MCYYQDARDGGGALAGLVGIRVVPRDCFGFCVLVVFRSSLGQLPASAARGPIVALGPASVLEGPWWLEDRVLEVFSALFEVLAACASELAGWPEAEVPFGFAEKYRVSAVFGGLLRAGFNRQHALGALLRSCGQFPGYSDVVLLWFSEEHLRAECLGHVCLGRAVDLFRDVWSV